MSGNTLFEELRRSFPLKRVGVFGQVLIVPVRASQRLEAGWEERLRQEGCRVYTSDYGNQAVFLIAEKDSVPNSNSVVDEKKRNRTEQAASGKKSSGWTEAEERKLVEMVEARKSFRQIAEDLGRTKDACFRKYKRLTDKSLSNQPAQNVPDENGPSNRSQPDEVKELLGAATLVYPTYPHATRLLVREIGKVLEGEK